MAVARAALGSAHLAAGGVEGVDELYDGAADVVEIKDGRERVEACRVELVGVLWISWVARGPWVG